MKNSLAIAISGLPPSIESTVNTDLAAWAPEWFDCLRADGRVTTNLTGTEIEESGINLPRLCELLAIEDDVAGITAGLRSNLDDSVASIASGDFPVSAFNEGLEHLADIDDDHRRGRSFRRA